MKVRFTRWYNALLSALLTMLGFESCSQYGPDEYGTPTVDYQVKGFVTDLHGTPIQGIKVRASNYYNGSEGQSVLTDENGRFELDEFHSELRSELYVEDIDGEANGGEFLSDTIDVRDLPRKEVGKGDGNWYEGKFEVNAIIRLERKE
jgi:putative lipoprotein (rSAM/lipoprotein system)